MRRLGATLGATVLLTALSAGAQDHGHEQAHDHDHGAKSDDSHEAGATSLSPALRALLVEEMLAIQAGMQAAIPALAAGRWSELATIGTSIRDSYILKQKLTAGQRAELKSKLPAGFIAADQRFHRTAEALAHAAKAHDAELASFYFYKMNEQCVSCHTSYAPERFPGLQPKPAHGGHEH